jgi:putative phosphoesterase
MRLAVLSDTHGNLPALEAVLMDIRRHDVDGIVVAGDLVGGPHANETIHLLRAQNAWMIRGNSDTYLLRYDAGEAPEAWYSSLQWALMRWGYRDLTRENIAFIGSLPEEGVFAAPGTATIRIVHGSPRSPSKGIDPDGDPESLEQALAQTTEPVLVCGHTHIPWKRERQGRLALNPGSVCGSLNGDVRAHYAILTWMNGRWEAEQYAVPYDLDEIRVAFQKSGLLEDGGALARCFLLSIETGHNVAEDFLAYARSIAEGPGAVQRAPITDPVWEQAAATFDWNRYSV